MAGLVIDFFVDFADYEPRSAPHFLIDSADIFADNAKTHDADADEEVEYREEREYPLGLGAYDQAADKKVNNEEGADHRYNDAEDSEHLERHNREAGHE